MDVPEMPLSYKEAGAKNKVTPIELIMPAMNRNTKLENLISFNSLINLFSFFKITSLNRNLA